MLIIRSWSFPKCTFTLHTHHSVLKPSLINNASEASAESKKVHDVSMGEWGGGSPEERPYDVSRGQNRYVTLLLGNVQSGKS